MKTPSLENLLLVESEKYLSNGSLNSAANTIDRLLQINPLHPRANELKAYLLFAQNQSQDAQKFLEVACKDNDASYEAFYSLGSIYLDNGAPDKALNLFQSALKRGGSFFELFHDLALCYAQLGNSTEAHKNFFNASEINPKSPELHFNWANLLEQSDELLTALSHYDTALTLEPFFLGALLNKGALLKKMGRHQEALVSLDKALEIKPDYAEAWSNKGNTLGGLKRFDEALSCYDKALEIRPNFAEAWSNRGAALNDMMRHEEALTSLNKALEIRPDYAEALLNKGNALHELALPLEAIEYFDRSFQLSPNYFDAPFNKSLSQLILGNFKDGWNNYEYRWDIQSAYPYLHPEITQLRNLEAARDKTVLVWSEQGFGDTFNFARYIQLLSNLKCNVYFEIHPSLINLFTPTKGVKFISSLKEVKEKIDFQCPLVSLPLLFNTNLKSIPPIGNLIAIDPVKSEKWKTILGAKTAPRVGIAWSSISNFLRDSKRSLRLSDLINFLPNNLEYICLQKEIKAEDHDIFKSQNLIKFYGDDFSNFSDTAALIDNVDLVVSTCTSIPHLSCSLSKPTYILLSHVPDWRWLLRDDSSPWYPSARLLRQSTRGNWSVPLNALRNHLLKLAN